MLRLSKLTDYAIVVLGFLAKNRDSRHAAAEIAEATGIALPTVSKVLKALHNGGLLESERGAKGGYYLAEPPQKISVAKVISLLDGPIALTECSISHKNCEQTSGCDMLGNWGVINRAIQTALESVTLADMIKPLRQCPDEFKVPVESIHPLDHRE